jgi:hypothetical protein
MFSSLRGIEEFFVDRSFSRESPRYRCMTDLSDDARHLLARYTLQKGIFVSIIESVQTHFA